MSAPASGDAFALPASLATFLGGAVDEARASLALRMASDTIRAALRQQINEVVDDVVLVAGESDGVSVFLPELPVTDVSLVEQLDYTGSWRPLIAPWDYAWDRAGVLTRLPGTTFLNGQRYGRWTMRAQSVRVTYTHGFNPVPAGLADVAVSVAARLYENPLGVIQERIGNYQEMYGARTGSVADFTDTEQMILDQYEVARVG